MPLQTLSTLQNKVESIHVYTVHTYMYMTYIQPTIPPSLTLARLDCKITEACAPSPASHLCHQEGSDPCGMTVADFQFQSEVKCKHQILYWLSSVIFVSIIII